MDAAVTSVKPGTYAQWFGVNPAENLCEREPLAISDRSITNSGSECTMRSSIQLGKRVMDLDVKVPMSVRAQLTRGANRVDLLFHPDELAGLSWSSNGVVDAEANELFGGSIDQIILGADYALFRTPSLCYKLHN